MTNKTVYFVLAAIAALIAYSIWTTIKLKESEHSNEWLEESVKYVSNQNQALSNENLRLKGKLR